MQQLNIQEIESAVNKYGEIVISKNRNDNVIIMSMEEYKAKEIKNDIINDLKQAEKEIANGEGTESDKFFENLRKKYGY